MSSLVANYGYSVVAGDDDRKASINMAIINMGIELVKTHLQTMKIQLPAIFKTYNIQTVGVLDNIAQMIQGDIDTLRMTHLQNLSAYSRDNDAFDNGPVLPKIIEIVEEVEQEQEEVFVWKPTRL
jgi:hypothetical protein